ncbi:BofC C-terminal domain-containing protein [Cohnella hongkongensis]|uniref:BofC C-terminal domain-containing protein n=1 Tax=Cohnella hongkongensis TaxID=178337 RepID=A0ABV9FGQ8_9BACL
MSRFRIFKELKKSLKRKRRHVWSLGMIAFAFMMASLAGTWIADRVVAPISMETLRSAEAAPVWPDEEPAATSAHTLRERTLLALQERKGDVELVLHRSYLCGEEIRRLGRHSASRAAELLKSHREWNASLDASGKLTVKEEVDDLSPQCRKTAYIGMDTEGNLSLFDGPPWKEKVIRTFFQLDVDMLESRLGNDRVRELAEGIRVSDKDEYNSVLSTFNEYASSIRSQAQPRP